MTGLETAIILIAFVTVASVLAYSVLSAGIFSAERGKQTVYSGLAAAQASMEVQGSVVGLEGVGANSGNITVVQFEVGLVISDEVVDTSAIIVNYFDGDVHNENVSANFTINAQCTERGTTTMLESDEVFTVSILLPAAATVDTYHKFTVQLIPPTGAALTISRITPGNITSITDLQ